MANKILIKFSKIAMDLTLFTLFSVILVFLASYLYVGPQLPAVETLKDIRLQTPMSVLTEDNQLIAEFGEKRRIPVSYQEIPEKLNQALIATEDRRFYSHGGVDAFGFARSVIQLLTTGRKGGGGSTITMQLARNFFLTFDTTFIRKTKEIFLSWKIERALSKEEILTLYWNKINFSNRAYGVGAAAQVYYGTTIGQLTLPQLAILAGIPKGPTTHNPLSNPEKAFNRRNHVLKRMQLEGYIDEELLNQSITAPLSATYHGSRVTVRAPYLAEMVRRKMIIEFGRDKAYTQGYKVYTTLNSQLQQTSRRSLRQSLVDYDRRHGYRSVERHFDELAPLISVLESSPMTEEITIESSSTENLNSEEVGNKVNLIDFDFKPIDEILGDIPVLGDLIPALVLSITEKSALVLLKKANRLTPIEDRLVTINWSGISWAREFINTSRRGARPRTVSEVLTPADLIRTYKDKEGNWQLTQLPEVSAAFVALKPNDGAIISLVGGFDYDFSKFNNVVQARRQPGSNIKPFIYSAAFEKGYTAATVVNDAPFTKVDASSENIWRPKNSSEVFKGPTRLRNALKSSTNLVSIRLLDDITPKYAVDYLSNLGFDRTRMPAVNSLALGAADFTPLELVSGFAIFANGGYKITPYFIQRIEDSNENIIFEEQPFTVCSECLEEIALKKLTQQSADNPGAINPLLLRADELNKTRLDAENTLFAEINQEQSVESDESGIFDNDTNQPSITKPELDDSSTASEDNNVAVETSTELSNETEHGFVIDSSVALSALPEYVIDEDKIAPRVIPEDNVYLINSMMQDVIHRGTAAPTLRRTGSPLLKRQDLAGKTGTTNEAKDAWFSGYNGDYVATAWVGYSDYSKGLGRNEFGGKAALPIWQKFMEVALKGKPENDLKQPTGLVTAKIDPDTGLLAPAGMRGAIFETFRLRYMPSKLAPTDLVDPFNNEDSTDEESIF